MKSHLHQPASKRVPGATCRLQFNRDFTFRQATDVLNYLRELGITDVYASPLFQAGPESTHGYDICCFGKVNSNIGTDAEFEIFANRLRELGLGLLLDMVPNHMGAALSNGWWLDVLEHGPLSRYAGFFDIDWEPADPTLKNKVLLPVLGDAYEKVLERGELKLGFESGKSFIGYYDRKFPVAKNTVEELSGAEFNSSSANSILSDFNGTPGNASSFSRLHQLLERQHYRLAHWRSAAEQINYRRFFDVSELVSLRIERPEVFEASHEVVFEWLKAGTITGLRIDHPDGLRDPKHYFERLQSRAAEISGTDQSQTVPNSRRDETCASPEQCLNPVQKLYVVAEKILSGDEPLPEDWPVAGTTGYDFLNRVNGLFVNHENEAVFNRIYQDFSGGKTASARDFEALILDSKRKILETLLISELNSLTRRLQQIAARIETKISFTFRQLNTALKEIIAAFPVYRTYLTEESLQPSAQDRAAMENAFTKARSYRDAGDPEAFDLLRRVLMLEVISKVDTSTAERVREFVLRFQQLTGPVMAKGLEDTAFYNYNRLISLNEVGGDPGRFGNSVEAFHNANATVAAHWPHTLIATATHDTKRGEDARARINILSELPREWEESVTRWSQWNASGKINLNGASAPTRNDEYLIYQSLVGALPHNSAEPAALEAFRTRASAFLLKAAREAKTNTSWLEPKAEYERALQGFVERILTECAENRFLPDLRRFVARVSFFGRINSLSQTVLKLASPGVPDFYQGTELWDFSFVDPDNRRPVDFELRRRMLSQFRENAEDATVQSGSTFQLPAIDDSGSAKLFVIWRGLELRNRRRTIFDFGTYSPLSVFGDRKEHVCAFARSSQEGTVLAVVPRLIAGLTGGMEKLPCGADIWGNAVLPLEKDFGTAWRNVFTEEVITTAETSGGRVLRLTDVLRTFPVALLESI